MTTTEPLAAFIARHGITMTAERAVRNPNMEEDRKNRMDHWLCTLTRKQGETTLTMETPFSMGSGHNGRPPQAADVLDCLASDSSGIENARGFEDWCAEYGYDTDSRKAERTFKVCEEQAQRLRQFLGAHDYEALLYHTERL